MDDKTFAEKLLELARVDEENMSLYAILSPEMLDGRAVNRFIYAGLIKPFYYCALDCREWEIAGGIPSLLKLRKIASGEENVLPPGRELNLKFVYEGEVIPEEHLHRDYLLNIKEPKTNFEAVYIENKFIYTKTYFREPEKSLSVSVYNGKEFLGIITVPFEPKEVYFFHKTESPNDTPDLDNESFGWDTFDRLKAWIEVVCG